MLQISKFEMHSGPISFGNHAFNLCKAGELRCSRRKILLGQVNVSFIIDADPGLTAASTGITTSRCLLQTSKSINSR